MMNRRQKQALLPIFAFLLVGLLWTFRPELYAPIFREIDRGSTQLWQRHYPPPTVSEALESRGRTHRNEAWLCRVVEAVDLHAEFSRNEDGHPQIYYTGDRWGEFCFKVAHMIPEPDVNSTPPSACKAVTPEREFADITAVRVTPWIEFVFEKEKEGSVNAIPLPTYSAVIGETKFTPDPSAEQRRLVEQLHAVTPFNQAPPSRHWDYSFAFWFDEGAGSPEGRCYNVVYESTSGKLALTGDMKQHCWCVLSPVFREHFLAYMRPRLEAASK